MRIASIVGTLALILSLASGGQSYAAERDYLSAGQIVAIGAGSSGMLLLGSTALDRDSTDQLHWTRPFGFETSIVRWLGGKPKPGRRNFLDSNLGSLATGLVAGTAILSLDLAYPPGDKSRDAAQGQFVYYSGLIANKGLTDMFKKLVGRPRPLLYMAPEIAAAQARIDYGFDHASFYSGHASSAFYAMTFLNKRVRSVMRRELLPHDYRNWRWLSPAVTYGWATFVALSRLQAYRHYPTDVAAGALAGFLVASLYYALADDAENRAEQSISTPLALHITFRL